MGQPDKSSAPEPRGGDELSALMKAAQEGDREAYTELLLQVSPIIRSLVRRHWPDARDTDDVVQDVLLALHRVRHTYDPDRPFLPWMMVIARNRLIDGRRRDVRIGRNEINVEALPETFVDDDANLKIAARAEAAALRRAIETLPDGQRKAVELLKLQEMSLKSASEASGMSVPALKTAMHRALRSLSKILGEANS